jgi:branched-subunit amino acid aminotransferase/4-amino-4-deoxychorismate lyase
MISHKVAPLLADAVGVCAVLNGRVVPTDALRRACAAASAAAAVDECGAPRAPQPATDTIYEVLRWRHGRACWLDAHARRMAATMAQFRYFAGGPAAEERWRALFGATVAAVAQRNGASEQNVKIVVWRQTPLAEAGLDASALVGESDEEAAAAAATTALFPALQLDATSDAIAADFNMAVFMLTSFYPPAAWYATGAVVGAMTAARPDPHSKVPMPEMRGRAARLQKEHGVFEVLLRRPSDGALTEGSRSNFLLIMSRADAGAESAAEATPSSSSATPAALRGIAVVESLDEDVLLGVTRTAVERVCAAHGVPVVKRVIRDADVRAALGMALTGTSLGVLPVREVVNFADGDAPRERVTFASAVPEALGLLQQLYVAARDAPSSAL